MPTLALIGCAHIHTPDFVRRLKSRSDVTVKYVYDQERPRAEVRAADLGAKVIASPGKALSDPDVQAVIVSSKTNQHKKLVMAAAQAGKHLFAEKPLGMKTADSLAMARAVKAAGVKFQTGYFSRGYPAILFARQMIQQGKLGQVTRIRASNCHRGSLGGWFDAKPQDLANDWRWMADPQQAGCGAFGDLGTHYLDLMLWLMGPIKSVSASIRSVTGRYGDCDESGEAMLKFENGAIGTLAAGWVDVGNPVGLLISGTQGHFTWMNNQVYFQSELVPGADGKTPWTELPAAWPHAFDLFLDSLSGKEAELVDISQALERVRVMEAIYRAAARRRWIDLPPLSPLCPLCS